MIYAYLDADRNVVGLATIDRSLAEAQQKNPDIAQRIDGAPAGLLALGNTSATAVEYHRLKEGAGGQAIEDYDALENLTPLRAARYAEFDAKKPILEARGATHDGHLFPVYLAAQTKWIGLATVKAGLPYPYPVATVEPGQEYSLANEGAFDALYGAIFSYVAWIEQSTQALAAAVLAATTKAEIDAIIDTR
jgi:hypothetical protein